MQYMLLQCWVVHQYVIKKKTRTHFCSRGAKVMFIAFWNVLGAPETKSHYSKLIVVRVSLEGSFVLFSRC
jgi:hypothetical protein